jgi:multiple sugar transport system permease protein
VVIMARTQQHRGQRRQLLSNAAHFIGLFLAMIIICLPGFWIVLSSSLRPTVEIMAKPPVWIPQELSLDAYVGHVRRRAGRHSGHGPISAIR